MDEHDRSILDSQAPLILRKMPSGRHHLARFLTGHDAESPAGVWWELVDAAAAADLPPAAVALTHANPDGSVTVSALGAGHAGATAALSDLLRVLTAALRGRAADMVIVRSTDRDLVPALLAVGFTRTADDDAGDCYVLAL